MLHKGIQIPIQAQEGMRPHGVPTLLNPRLVPCNRFARSDLVIAKGQGNYETLGGKDRNIFFLLKVKCPVIARDIGCEVGQIVVGHERPRQDAAKLTPPESCVEQQGLLPD